MFNYQKIIAFSVVLLALGIYRLIALKANKRPKMPILLFVIFAALGISTPIFEYYGLVSTANQINVAAAVVLAMAIIRMVVFFVVDYFIRFKNNVQMPTITRDFILAILYIIAAMIVLKQKTNVNLGSLITTSAILTAVIGFAMQDTLGNLFSGLALQLESPYEIGDWIGFEGVVGKVVGITWKSTKILTRSEELIFVPNNTIAKSTLTNYSRPTPRHNASIEIGASYDDPPHKVRRALIEIMQSHPRVMLVPAPAVRVVKYDNFSVNYKAVFSTEDIANEELTKLELLNAIWYRFRREGIKIPYPIQEQVGTTPEEMFIASAKKGAHDKQDILETITNIDIFATVSEENRRELAANVAILQYGEGEDIVRQGGSTGPMYIIKEGEVAILVSHDGGQLVEIKRLGEGQVFGEMSVLTGAPRTATVRATTDCVCYEVDKNDLRALFAKEPDAMERVSAILTKRSTELLQHKEMTEIEIRNQRDQEKQLLNKIKAFFKM